MRKENRRERKVREADRRTNKKRYKKEPVKASCGMISQM